MWAFKYLLFGAHFASVLAQLSETCYDNSGQQVCYRLNIPETTASSGQGDIFLQLTAPTTYSYVAFGPGSGMTDSLMFIMYAASDSNVTVSTRLGVGQTSPQYTSNMAITLLEGTGIEDGVMTANLRCSDCHTWTGGNIDYTQSTAQWIHAAYLGSPLNSVDLEAPIQQHNAGHESFALDMTTAKGGSSLNPFLSAAPVSGEGSIRTITEPFPVSMLIAHGVLASLAMVIFFPLGSISLRLLNFPGLIWVHAGIQMLALAIFTIGTGLGIYIAVVDDYLEENHAGIGLFVFALLLLQPVLGFLHHRGFIKHQTRTLWSHLHIWIGRIMITLGIINGGLGLLLADNSTDGQNIAYGVVAGVVWVSWMCASMFGEIKKARQPSQQSGLEKAGDRSNASSREVQSEFR